jgi:hypothetical protein
MNKLLENLVEEHIVGTNCNEIEMRVFSFDNQIERE